MNIINFEKKHVKEAMEITLANYNDERQYVKELPKVCDIPDLYGFAENGLGVAAFENEKMIGFLCCCEPFDNAFHATDVRGIFFRWAQMQPFLKTAPKFMQPCIRRQEKNG